MKSIEAEKIHEEKSRPSCFVLPVMDDSPGSVSPAQNNHNNSAFADAVERARQVRSRYVYIYWTRTLVIVPASHVCGYKNTG